MLLFCEIVKQAVKRSYSQDIKMFLESKGYKFESETDTECIAKLVKHIRSQNPSYTFRQLVEQTISQVCESNAHP